MNVNQYRDLIVRPALLHIRLWSAAAEELVLGTAVHESDGLKYIKQLGGGPALGFVQMEPATCTDIHKNFLVFNPHIRSLLQEIEPSMGVEALVWNMRYGAAMCRLHYRRRKEPMPAEGDFKAQAAYWKAHYNTNLGKGTVKEYLEHWYTYVV